MIQTKCSCGLEMTPVPVPGAERFPRRLECPIHGYPQERKVGLFGSVTGDEWREELADLIPANYAEVE